MAYIDYLTISLGNHKSYTEGATDYVLKLFASLLPDTYVATCRDMVCSEGKSERVSQFGISVSMQYGSALLHGWVYSVQLSGNYWHAIEHDREAVTGILALTKRISNSLRRRVYPVFRVNPKKLIPNMSAMESRMSL